IENDTLVLDYTWNWGPVFAEADPVMNVFRVPRLNINLDDDPLGAKKAFTAGLFINATPRRIDHPNATALVSEKPALAAALKQVAALRKQFLPYFTEGR